MGGRYRLIRDADMGGQQMGGDRHATGDAPGSVRNAARAGPARAWSAMEELLRTQVSPLPTALREEEDRISIFRPFASGAFGM